MTRTEEYLQNATLCRARAREAELPSRQRMLEEAALSWERLAAGDATSLVEHWGVASLRKGSVRR